LLSILQLNIPNDALCVIGLTMSDLYREEADLFVAGWAARRSRVAVFSFFRYDPSLTFSPADWFIQCRNQRMKPQQIQKSIFQRSCKLLVHEIGKSNVFQKCFVLHVNHQIISTGELLMKSILLDIHSTSSFMPCFV
jgi:predicted Zn-dependent protease